MKLKKEYEIHQELVKNKLAFDPEEEVFLTDGNPKEYTKPPGYEDWGVKKYDFKEYFNKRMAELGVGEQENGVLLRGGVNLQNTELVTQPVFHCNRFGHIEILQYGLNGRPHTVKKDNKERYVYQTRLNPWAARVFEGKYDFSFGKNCPFWHKSLLESFEKKDQLEYLVITEGQIKAFKACMMGVPTVGLTSISHFRDKTTGTIHPEIIEFCQECAVKNLVILWDGDCRSIRVKDVEEGNDLARRPLDFYNYAAAIKKGVVEYVKRRNFKVFFATIKTEEIPGEPKGIDDLFCCEIEPAEIIRNFETIGHRPGNLISSIDITSEDGIKKMRKFFQLHDPKAFYQLHADKIRGAKFTFQGSTYRVEKNIPIIEVSADIRCYKRIGINYYKLDWAVFPTGRDNETRLEEVLEPWSRSTIVDDHGKEVIKHIERYSGFTNVPSHTNYQQAVNNRWNLYYNIDIETSEGSFEHIDILLRHIFEEQYEMILDYIQILYLYPMRKLPVICLVSKTQETGKSTFLYLLKLIFKQNMTFISNSDLTESFNSHWTSSLIVACEETIVDKKDGYEKIKNLSTAKEIMRNEKNKTQQSIPCMVHFILLSNHEDTFIKIDDSDSRLWIRKVKKIETEIKDFDEKLEDEIPHFMHFIKKRAIKHERKGRLYFAAKDFRTAAFEQVVKQSEPALIKEIREVLTDYFTRYNEPEFRVTPKDLADYFGIRISDTAYINRAIKEYFGVERGSLVRYYFLRDATPAPTRVKNIGRPFVFEREKHAPVSFQPIEQLIEDSGKMPF